MLLPHVLLQICKGVEWLQLWAQGTFMLQQLPAGQEGIPRFPLSSLKPLSTLQCPTWGRRLGFHSSPSSEVNIGLLQEHSVLCQEETS